MTASELAPGDSIVFLMGGLAHVRHVTDLGDGLVSVRAEVTIPLQHDDVVMLFNTKPETREA